MSERHPWMVDAACLDVDPDMFFAEDSNYRMLAAARQVCAGCPVRVRNECLNYAVEHGIREGIWGGKTQIERARVRRAARKSEVSR